MAAETSHLFKSRINDHFLCWIPQDILALPDILGLIYIENQGSNWARESYLGSPTLVSMHKTRDRIQGSLCLFSGLPLWKLSNDRYEPAYTYINGQITQVNRTVDLLPSLLGPYSDWGVSIWASTAHENQNNLRWVCARVLILQIQSTFCSILWVGNWTHKLVQFIIIGPGGNISSWGHCLLIYRYKRKTTSDQYLHSGRLS